MRRSARSRSSLDLVKSPSVSACARSQRGSARASGLRPEGIFHYCPGSPDGQEMWGKFVYREIAPPARLHFVVSFSDETGGLTRHPWVDDWPLETLSTITLAEDGRGTRLTVRWVPHNASEAERNAFAAGHDSMRQSWTGTPDQLAEDLAKVREDATPRG